jgi:hypothetical protein
MGCGWRLLSYNMQNCCEWPIYVVVRLVNHTLLLFTKGGRLVAPQPPAGYLFSVYGILISPDCLTVDLEAKTDRILSECQNDQFQDPSDKYLLGILVDFVVCRRDKDTTEYNSVLPKYTTYDMAQALLPLASNILSLSDIPTYRPVKPSHLS